MGEELVLFDVPLSVDDDAVVVADNDAAAPEGVVEADGVGILLAEEFEAEFNITVGEGDLMLLDVVAAVVDVVGARVVTLGIGEEDLAFPDVAPPTVAGCVIVAVPLKTSSRLGAPAPPTGCCGCC
jgi:hypothetical protein